MNLLTIESATFAGSFLGAVAGTLLREGFAKAVVEPVARLLFRRSAVSAIGVVGDIADAWEAFRETFYAQTDDEVAQMVSDGTPPQEIEGWLRNQWEGLTGEPLPEAGLLRWAAEYNPLRAADRLGSMNLAMLDSDAVEG